MKIPLYSETPQDIYTMTREGDQEGLHIREFISNLYHNYDFEFPQERGVIAFAYKWGTRSLTAKQMQVLKIVISKAKASKCKVCSTSKYDSCSPLQQGLCNRCSYTVSMSF